MCERGGLAGCLYHDNDKKKKRGAGRGVHGVHIKCDTSVCYMS